MCAHKIIIPIKNLKSDGKTPFNRREHICNYHIAINPYLYCVFIALRNYKFVS